MIFAKPTYPFAKGVYPEDVPNKLRYYELVRKSRAETIQEFSRAQIIGLRDTGSMPDPQITQAFAFGHDVIGYAKAIMSAVWIPSIVSKKGAPPAGQEPKPAPKSGAE